MRRKKTETYSRPSKCQCAGMACVYTFQATTIRHALILHPHFFFCWQVLAKCTSERDPDDYVLMLKLKEGGKKTNLFGTSKKGYKVGTITQ